MEVIILAGGFGKRLQSVVHDVPKPMADIKGRPFLAYLLDYFLKQQATRFLLSVGYKQEQIVSYFGSRYKDREIVYVREDEPLGTGGAIRAALLRAQEDTVIAANGDSFLAVDLSRMLKLHAARFADMTMAVTKAAESGRYGTVQIEGERVTGFLEKSHDRSGYINGGVYVLNRDRILNLTEEQGRTFSFETDFLQKTMEKTRVFVYSTAGYFIDIGVPEDYKRAQNESHRFQEQEAGT